MLELEGGLRGMREGKGRGGRVSSLNALNTGRGRTSMHKEKFPQGAVSVSLRQVGQAGSPDWMYLMG